MQTIESPTETIEQSSQDRTEVRPRIVLLAATWTSPSSLHSSVHRL